MSYIVHIFKHLRKYQDLYVNGKESISVYLRKTIKLLILKSWNRTMHISHGSCEMVSGYQQSKKWHPVIARVFSVGSVNYWMNIDYLRWRWCTKCWCGRATMCDDIINNEFNNAFISEIVLLSLKCSYFDVWEFLQNVIIIHIIKCICNWA